VAGRGEAVFSNKSCCSCGAQPHAAGTTPRHTHPYEGGGGCGPPGARQQLQQVKCVCCSSSLVHALSVAGGGWARQELQRSSPSPPHPSPSARCMSCCRWRWAWTPWCWTAARATPPSSSTCCATSSRRTPTLRWDMLPASVLYTYQGTSSAHLRRAHGAMLPSLEPRQG